MGWTPGFPWKFCEGIFVKESINEFVGQMSEIISDELPEKKILKKCMQ